MATKRAWVYGLLFSAVTINYVDRVALSVAARPIAVAYHLSSVELGYLFSAFLWTYALFAIPWGLVTDRFGTRRITAAGMVWWSLATIATGVIGWSYGLILTTRLLMGVGESSTYPTAERVLREWIPARERGFATVIFNAGGYAGPAIGSVLVGLIAAWLGWRAAFVAIGILGLLWAAIWLAWFRLPETSPHLGEAERRYILQTRDAPLDAPSAPFAALVASRSVWGIALTQGAIIYALYMLLTWMPSYLASVRHLDVLRTGVYAAIPFAVAAPVSILVGWCSDRLLAGQDVSRGGRRRFVIAALLCSVVIVLVPFAVGTWQIIALFAVALCCIASAAGLNLALLGDLVRSQGDAGRATGLQLSLATVFGILSPIVTGYVIEGTGSYDGAFVLAAAILLAGALVCFVLTRDPIPGPVAAAVSPA